MSSVEEAANELRERWNEFIVAIKDIEHDFNQFYWIHVLSLSAIKYIFHLSRIIHVIRFVKMHRGQFVQLIPGFAIGLVFIVISSYVTVFHHEIIVPRWCSCDEGYISCKADGFVGNSDCRSSIVIKLVSLYLTSMIMFNYLQTTLRSPGVMPSLERNNSLGAGRTPSDERGGCCFFIKPKFNQLRENEIVALNGKIVTEEHYPGDDKKVFLPSPNSSYCEKCKIHRPPRCHHCSRCNRCVLQMDHHCIWFNNCIGYNNYRTFLLTIMYLTVGCWYGVGLLFMPFYETIEEQLKTQGLKFFYENKTGFLDLPMPMTIIKDLLHSGTIQTQILIKIVFPFLFFVGIFLSSFLWSHLTYVAAGLTTLERLAEIKFMIGKVQEQSVEIVNPYNQGLRGNLTQVMGKSMWLGLLPLEVKPMPPLRYSPKKKSD